MDEERAKTDPRPEPSGKPPVWADKRQFLAESVPYYRHYEGAVYSSGKVVKGFLVDKECEDRDVYDDQIIITTM